MENTERLAQFVHDLSLDDVPAAVVECSKYRLIDTIGVAMFATQTPWGKIITEFVRKHGSAGNSTLWGITAGKTGPLSAALANGTYAHGFELDDVHYPSISHPGSVIVPAVVALGEYLQTSGRTILEAIIVGYEMMGRVGSSIARHHLAKGFHPTGTFGTFGAAAACAKVLGLSSENIQNAFGLAGSFASGLAQFSITGSMVKRIHAGHAAESGMKAALLAKDGFTGPREILEGKYGFCHAFAGDPDAIDWNALTAGIGSRYVVEEISVKPSAACGVLHAVIDCIKQIHTERHLKEDEITEILILGHENLVHEHNVYKPTSILAAQYSLPFTVGLAVTGKVDNPTVYLDETILKEPHVLRVASKVRTALDDEIQTAFPKKFGAKVAISFTDGMVCRKTVIDPKGSSEQPFSSEEVKRKFRTMTKAILSDETVEFILNNINGLEHISDITTLPLNSSSDF